MERVEDALRAVALLLYDDRLPSEHAQLYDAEDLQQALIVAV